ncbi:MAG: LytTR family DNA-binding domain-containing protein [Roseivirga sp.]
MNVKAVIVDDEFLARQRIIKLLEAHEYVSVVGEAKNADQAIEVIKERAPDLVFLDVQMPGANGFSVLERLSLKKAPVIIFTTAFDQYALDAFKVHAIDYLLKPFEQERFDEAVNLAKEQLNMKRSANLNEQMMNLLNSYQQADEAYWTTMKLKEKGREVYVKVDDLLYLETAGNYVVLQTMEKQYLYRSTMNDLEAVLNPDEFLRIHRSFLVNKRFVKSQRYAGGNEFLFEMKNGKSLSSAKSYKESITRFLDIHF